MGLDFLKEGKSKKYSFTRITGFILVLFYILVAGYLSFKTNQFVDIPAQLAFFLTGLYGINKFSNTLSDYLRTKQSQQESTNYNNNYG